MSQHPLSVLEELDPELLALIERTNELAMAEGAIPRKYKLLIAMALDAARGTIPGVASLARQALEAGATREEIAEALRVAQLIDGVGCIYTAARALNDVL